MTLKPVIGSNQFKTKFDEEAKPKKRTRVKFKTKALIVGVSLLLASVIGNYCLLKAFMVFKCTDGGYFISKQYCGELYQNANDSIELDRQHNNEDLYVD